MNEYLKIWFLIAEQEYWEPITNIKSGDKRLWMTGKVHFFMFKITLKMQVQIALCIKPSVSMFVLQKV